MQSINFFEKAAQQYILPELNRKQNDSAHFSFDLSYLLRKTAPEHPTIFIIASFVPVVTFAGRRRTTSHPCPVCGKTYVNEGSLRKHIAGHPEASGMSTPLRMWPCTVCQSVFTQESGKMATIS